MVRILIIEDDEEMRALLKDSLLEDGIEFDSAENGSEAIRKLVEEPFDLVITDIRMPRVDGIRYSPGDQEASTRDMHHCYYSIRK